MFRRRCRDELPGSLPRIDRFGQGGAIPQPSTPRPRRKHHHDMTRSTPSIPIFDVLLGNKGENRGLILRHPIKCEIVRRKQGTPMSLGAKRLLSPRIGRCELLTLSDLATGYHRHIAAPCATGRGGPQPSLSRREQDHARGLLLAGQRPSTGRSGSRVREGAVSDSERTLAL